MRIIYTDGHPIGANTLLNTNICANKGYTKLVIDGKEIKIEYDKKLLTNSEAELIAIIHACFYAKKGDLIISDSQYAVNSIVNNWKAKEVRLDNLVAVAKTCFMLSGAKLEWRKRDKNLAT